MMEMVMMTRTMPVRCRTFSTSFKLVHPQFPLFFLNQSSSQSCYFFQTFIIIWWYDMFNYAYYYNYAQGQKKYVFRVYTIYVLVKKWRKKRVLWEVDEINISYDEQMCWQVSEVVLDRMENWAEESLRFIFKCWWAPCALPQLHACDRPQLPLSMSMALSRWVADNGNFGCYLHHMSCLCNVASIFHTCIPYSIYNIYL